MILIKLKSLTHTHLFQIHDFLLFTKCELPKNVLATLLYSERGLGPRWGSQMKTNHKSTIRHSPHSHDTSSYHSHFLCSTTQSKKSEFSLFAELFLWKLLKDLIPNDTKSLHVSSIPHKSASYRVWAQLLDWVLNTGCISQTSWMLF